MRRVDCLGNILGDVVTWPKTHSLAAKEETRSNSLGKSKMCHFCRINECYGGGGWMGGLPVTEKLLTWLFGGSYVPFLVVNF